MNTLSWESSRKISTVFIKKGVSKIDNLTLKFYYIIFKFNIKDCP